MFVWYLVSASEIVAKCWRMIVSLERQILVTQISKFDIIKSAKLKDSFNAKISDGFVVFGVDLDGFAIPDFGCR